MKSFPILSLLFLATTTTTGLPCQSDADCLNGGQCSTGSLRLCQCPLGFGGDDCSARCSKTCLNGGSCRFHQDISHGGSDQDGNEYCQCPPEFLGVDCEIQYVLCGTLKCLHGGTCENNACSCPSPRTGDQCQYDSPDDPRIPSFKCQKDAECLNGGECINTQVDDAYCFCRKGFGGEDCTSKCDRDCQNGGSCRFHKDISHGSDQDGNTYCECPPHRFLGVHCEIPYLVCPGSQELKCLHGGTCERGTNDVGYTCKCPGTRAGEVCQYATSQEEEAARASNSASSSSTSSSGSDYDDNSLTMALILLAAALVGAGFITCVAMVLCRRQTPIGTRNEIDITAATAQGQELGLVA